MNNNVFVFCLAVRKNHIKLMFFVRNCVGVLCNCVLPPRLNESKVRRVVKGELSESEKRKLRHRSRSGPLLSSSSSSSTPDNHRSHIRAKSTGNHPSCSSSSSTSSGSKKYQRPKAQDHKSPNVSVKT